MRVTLAAEVTQVRGWKAVRVEAESKNLSVGGGWLRLIGFGAAGGVAVFLMVLAFHFWCVNVVEHDRTWGRCGLVAGWCEDVPVATISRFSHLDLPEGTAVLDSSAKPHGGADSANSLTATVRLPDSTYVRLDPDHMYEGVATSTYRGSQGRQIITVRVSWTGTEPPGEPS